ncbi:MAG: hypothetical protein KIT48_18390 [Pseudolabrys sp.]|nr:hypothetical protein [Pseudolabrys sp.]
MEIRLAQSVPIRSAGLDEYWLQTQIIENPDWLGLGDLEPIAVERQQSSGGRLDILLKNPEDDAMFEVEVMLGSTDETHIIRTIEYWDIEKRKWPRRKHSAVLVAENINKRFFNVVHILSNAIPIIAIQVALIDIDGKKHLHFTKMLDTYEEIDDGTSLRGATYTRDYWSETSQWTLDAADELLRVVGGVFEKPSLNFLKYYIALTVGGYNYMWLHKRSMGKSLLGFRIAQALQDEAASLLDERNIAFVRTPIGFRVTVDREAIQLESELIVKLSRLIKRTWEGE